MTATLTCSSCGELTPAGKFCIHCGASTQVHCPTCGEPVVPGAKFCLECGGTLAGGAASPTSHAAEPISERRLVSVLFADLVGFTALSEHRDPEEVRELLSRYFDRCRTLIGRYGGTVEKFIGDAVMAVWGTPVAREDDAERAVRAALALTQAVAALGLEAGMPELRLRAGVLTGSAAVEIGAEGEGMVLGDTVNTASRLQSIAAPGTVLVDGVTHHASEAAIAYEDAGTHVVKGREQPVHAWMALRVVAGAGGARRGAGVEAPFVGRERELEAIIEAGEKSAHEGRARHVAVLGEAGSGKSRLVWEFFKYLDGIEEVRYWHQGRCLSYGEGVAYWALAEVVRARAGIQEEETPTAARQKLRTAVEQFVPEERERRLVEPRLAHLLRLEERADSDRADLFSGWRLFFERVSQDAPVVLAFEDLQWADSGLLDFIDYLLEWSADFPIFVLTLGRPELRERRPSWEPLALETLEPQAIAKLLDGVVPGLPPELVAEIVHRAEGIPLYAVETIRMLQDRGLLIQEGARYVVKGDISELEVPETLHALVASRLDGLSAAERALLQDASVLGQSVTAGAAAALSGLPEAEVMRVFDGLVAKQILGRDDDPRSPERGQYVFLQGLLRTVAYGTLSRRARKAKHLAAAVHLEQTWPGEARDVAEVLASHYLEAIAADPDAEDARTLRKSARERLTAAGQAAASLALGSEADRYFAQAAELSTDDLERAKLLEQAGRALWRSGDSETAEVRLREAIALHERTGRSSGGPAAVTLATALATAGRRDEAYKLMERFLADESADRDRVLRAQALAAVANWVTIEGDTEQAERLFAEALVTLEHARELPALAEAMARRGVLLQILGRFEESLALTSHARRLAEQHDVPAVALRAMFTQIALLLEFDQYSSALPDIHRGLEIARELGDRTWERMMLSELIQCQVSLGNWDDPAVALLPDLLVGEHDAVTSYLLAYAAQVAAARGDEALLARTVELAAPRRDSGDPEFIAMARVALAHEARAHGRLGEVIELLRPVFAASEISGELRTEGYALTTDAALTSRDESTVAELLASLEALRPVNITPVRMAQRARLLAEQAHLRGDRESTAAHEREAVELLRSVGVRCLLVDALLDSSRRGGDAVALAEARAIYEELGATRLLERLDGVTEVVA